MSYDDLVRQSQTSGNPDTLDVKITASGRKIGPNLIKAFRMNVVKQAISDVANAG